MSDFYDKCTVCESTVLGRYTSASPGCYLFVCPLCGNVWEKDRMIKTLKKYAEDKR